MTLDEYTTLVAAAQAAVADCTPDDLALAA